MLSEITPIKSIKQDIKVWTKTTIVNKYIVVEYSRVIRATNQINEAQIKDKNCLFGLA